MLYKKNVSQILEDDLFKNPTSEYRGTPFWAWNCELDKEELLWQIEQLKKMGFGGFHMHSRSGMATEYLSEDFFDLVKACVDKAEQEDMLAYLYDEDRWPSGAAGGIVTKNRKYSQRNIKITVTPDESAVDFAEAVNTGKTYFVCAYDVMLNDLGELEEYQYIKDISCSKDERAVRWYVYSFVTEPSGWYNNQTYLDTLSKEAVDKFIEVTHEAYKNHVGDKFGKSIPSIFTDEPNFSSKGTLDFALDRRDICLPWTFDFDETFKNQYGYSILEKLPELFWELPNGKISVARYNYHDHITQRFVDAFAANYGNWCRKNGIYFTGHVLEEQSLASQTASVGETMRFYRHFGIPGIDILCDKREFTTAKQAQSITRQDGKEGVMSELYGVTNWDYDFRGHKFQGDWQAAMGITLRVPHLSWVSMKGEAKRDYPASINYQSSWYKEYKYIENHYARLNTALTRGKPIVKVAVIHPIETYWLHWGPKESTADVRNMLDEQFMQTNRWLLSGLMDFDYICESVLPEQIGKISDKLCVGEMEYSAVVISGCETLRSTTVDILEKFRKAGGKIIFVGDAPKYIDAFPSERVKDLYNDCITITHSKPQLLNALETERFVDIRNIDGTRSDNLIYQSRKDTDGTWLFIAHMHEETAREWQGSGVSKNIVTEYKRQVIINGEYTPLLYDTISGEIKKVDFEIKNGQTVIYYTFYTLDSLLLKLCPPTEKSYFSEKENKKVHKSIHWLEKVKYTRSEENVLLLDVGNYKLDNEKYNEKEETLKINDICRSRLNFINNATQPWVIEKEEICHFVTMKYEFESEIEVGEAYVATEDFGICDIVFNGQKVPNIACGYFTDKSIGKIKLPSIVKGKNTLEITYPFGTRTCVENCFILGDFNVVCEGCTKKIVEKSDVIGFGDIVPQGMPFYGANITYEMCFETDDVYDVRISTSNYVGAVVKVRLDGEEVGVIAYSPYSVTVPNVEPGKHKLEITLCGTRYNSFGSLHQTDDKLTWFGPNAWRRNAWGENDLTQDYSNFKYEYNCKPMGIMASPKVKFLK